MSKPLSKTTAGIMGSFLLTIGAAGIVFTIFQQTNPGVAIMIGLFSGCLAVGTGVGTAVRMSNGNRDSTNDATG
jgi:hypothetical protein